MESNYIYGSDYEIETTKTLTKTQIRQGITENSFDHFRTGFQFNIYMQFYLIYVFLNNTHVGSRVCEFFHTATVMRSFAYLHTHWSRKEYREFSGKLRDVHSHWSLGQLNAKKSSQDGRNVYITVTDGYIDIIITFYGHGYTFTR